MEFTPKQRKALNELRQRISGWVPVQYEKDEELIKWIIARKYDIGKAESMILESMRWRKEWNIDSLLDWDPPEVLLKYCPAGHVGVDKNGFPLYIVRSGSTDMKGMLRSASRRNCLLYNMQVLEHAQTVLAKKTEKTRTSPIFQITVIVDLENYSLEQSMWKPAMNYMRELTIMHESNYPEIMKKAYIINSPKIFTVFYSAMRPFMGEDTINKMKFYGKNDWQDAILEDIDSDQLPVYYGGTMTDLDGNEKCLSKICWGGFIPKTFYHKLKHKLDFSEYETVTVPNGSKKTFEFKVNKSSSRLRWQIECEDFDIGFGIKYQNGDTKEVALPEQRANAELCPEEGELICEKEGFYTLTLNNEFSLLRSKKVHYKFKLEEPSEFGNN